MELEPVCGRCSFCVKDDCEPYCVLKDLFTTVRLDDKCNERDVRGNIMFARFREEKYD